MKPAIAVDTEAQRQTPRQTNRREPGGDIWQAGVERRIAKLDAVQSAGGRLAEHAAVMRERYRPLKSHPGLSLAAIQSAVEKKFGWHIGPGSGRYTDVARARHVAWYLARTLTTHSLPQIARTIGCMHHTSALSAILKIQRLSETDLVLARAVQELTEQLTGVSQRPAQTGEIPYPDLSGEWAI